jgi:hypothetical protein
MADIVDTIPGQTAGSQRKFEQPNSLELWERDKASIEMWGGISESRNETA